VTAAALANAARAYEDVLRRRFPQYCWTVTVREGERDDRQAPPDPRRSEAE
jgi:hypothetical protein